MTTLRSAVGFLFKSIMNINLALRAMVRMSISSSSFSRHIFARLTVSKFLKNQPKAGLSKLKARTKIKSWN